MRALFITTQTVDTWNHIQAWDSVYEPAVRCHFDHLSGIGIDHYVLTKAKMAEPDVIFYIGGNIGRFPKTDTFLALREIAPMVNILSDASDEPTHNLIEEYRKKECFDVQVGIDGDPKAPVDLVTLTPVDPRPFDQTVQRDIHCGFSGNTSGKRHRLLAAVGSHCWIRLRTRDYDAHCRFMKRCRMIVNTCWTGSGEGWHVKGRVVETGHAGAALLEPTVSPTSLWFPDSAYFKYDNAEHLIDVIQTARDDDIAERAAEMSRIVKEKYTAAKIYGAMLAKLNVDDPVAV